MQIVPNQFGQIVTIYDSINEAFYNLFLEIGLFVNQNGYLQDQDTGIVIRFKDKFIKVSLNENVPLYTGKTDVPFEPARNFMLMQNLLGYYIDKREASDEPIGYSSQGIYDKRDTIEHQVFVKTLDGTVYESGLYHNTYLAFMDCIFRLSGSIVDLHNLDFWEEKK